MERLAIRNIQKEVMEGLASLAERHERSTEAEARYALDYWLKVHADEEARGRRTQEIGMRLRQSLTAVNEVAKRPEIRPSHLAQEIGETHAEPAERWFAGVEEPGFAQLAEVAGFLGINPAWLQHGDQRPFEVIVDVRIPSDHEKAIAWFLEPPFRDRWREKVKSIHFVRSDNNVGNLAVVHEFEQSRSFVHLTPYHLSKETGSGGKGDLADLSNIFCLLYKMYAKKGVAAQIASYVAPSLIFDKLTSGVFHPLALLRSCHKASWWEDWWDPKMFRENERANDYWPEWQSLSESIYLLVMETAWRKEWREKILNGSHPVLQDI